MLTALRLDCTLTGTLALPKGSSPATFRAQTEYKNIGTKGVKVETDTKIPFGNARYAPCAHFECVC